MQLTISVVKDYEMVHYASPELFIAHKANLITYINREQKLFIPFPGRFSMAVKVALKFRKIRRMFRLDKAMIIPTEAGLVLFRQGEIWCYDIKNRIWQASNITLNCRNPMYNGILCLPSGELFVGEYGNPGGLGKRIFKSIDNGYTWSEVYSFLPGEIRHIHCLAWDHFKEKIWIFTGDADEESKVLCCDKEFENMEVIGRGSQVFRTCHVMFSDKTVDWIMDSPIETVRHVQLERSTRKVSLHNYFAGPVWFTKKLLNGITVVASIQEIGPSHIDRLLHLYATKDMESWQELIKFKHDGWPKRYFRFGTICFARGNFEADSFYMFCEGVKGLDGKSVLCRIVD